MLHYFLSLIVTFYLSIANFVARTYCSCYALYSFCKQRFKEEMGGWKRCNASKKKAGHQAQNKRCSKSNWRARGKLKYPESKPIHAYDHKGKFSERGVQLSGSLESSQNQSVTFQNGQRTFREPTWKLLENRKAFKDRRKALRTSRKAFLGKLANFQRKQESPHNQMARTSWKVLRVVNRLWG